MEGKIIQFTFNVDDMTPEEISFACDVFFENGANEVYTSPVYMKKNRIGTLFTVFCKQNDKDKFIELIFKNTTTLGVKGEVLETFYLERNITTIQTEYGDVRLKTAKGYGITKEKYEYDDLAKTAKENDISIKELKDKINKGR